MRLAVNIAMFQLVWWTCVLSGARGIEWPGPLLALAALGVHLALTADRVREAALVMAVALAGFGGDALLTMLGVLGFHPHVLGPLPPLWIGALWLGFATTINVTFAWFRGRTAAAAALGLLSGPLAYSAGEALGALTLNGGWFGALTLGATWAALLAVAFGLVARPAAGAAITGACAAPDRVARSTGGGA